jgi:hypothetical protein
MRLPPIVLLAVLAAAALGPARAQIDPCTSRAGASVNTRRLMWFVGNLDERKTALRDRKLRLATASVATP